MFYFIIGTFYSFVMATNLSTYYMLYITNIDAILTMIVIIGQ